MMELRTLLLLAVSILLLAGCNDKAQPQNTSKNGQSQATSQAAAPREPSFDRRGAERAEAIAKRVRGVDQAVAVVMDRQISIAAKVSGFERFRLKAIRRDVHHQLKASFPDHEIHVTTDKKLFWELEKLKAKVDRGAVSFRQAKQQVEKINQDMKG
ncbi:MAG TPA: YhcN/YlaJ family sporulation lipoprotein [Calditerricola sp.]